MNTTAEPILYFQAKYIDRIAGIEIDAQDLPGYNTNFLKDLATKVFSEMSEIESKIEFLRGSKNENGLTDKEQIVRAKKAKRCRALFLQVLQTELKRRKIQHHNQNIQLKRLGNLSAQRQQLFIDVAKRRIPPDLFQSILDEVFELRSPIKKPKE
jgi:hypothetical protein